MQLNIETLKPLDNIEEVRLGFENFKTFIEQIKSRGILEQIKLSSDLRTLLAVFTGIKPSSSSIDLKTLEQINEFLPETIRVEKDIVFNTESLSRTLRKYKDIMEVSGEELLNLDLFINRLTSPELASKNPRVSLSDLRKGLCFGFPYNTVINYATTSSSHSSLFQLIEIFNSKSESELKIELGLSQDSTFPYKEFKSIVNMLALIDLTAVLSVYRNKFMQIITFFNLAITPEDYDNLSMNRFGWSLAIGEFAWVGIIKDEDLNYLISIQQLYKELGIDDYIDEQLDF